jgi:transmembrane sensor
MPAPVASRRALALWWGGSGLSVALAAAVAVAVLQPQPASKPTWFVTGKGERRDVVLSDGTRVALNADTRLSVLVQRGRRELTLASGEAAFQVVHDPSRPFMVQVGDRVLEDVGTDFDVEWRDGLVSVSVREGRVAVLRPHGEQSLSLGAGGHLEHREGGADSVTAAADADDAFAWRSGRLIYRNRTLSEVARDLSRYGAEDIRAEGAAANLRFSGVLTIDNQSGMVHRLTGLLPVVASDRKDGVIVLSELNTSR